MAELTKLFDELKNDYNQEKEHPEKFVVSLTEANEDNKTLLAGFGIKLKPSQWIVLTIEPEILEKTLLRAKDLGFLDAYQQNAAFLKHDVDKVIKRIGECEAYGIAYKNEKGKYQPWLFSNRGYAYVVKGKVAPTEKKEDKATTPSYDIEELREYANRVMETFALESEKEKVYAKLTEVAASGMAPKEMLMQLFQEYADNLDYLSSTIDEILENNKENNLGRVA